MWKFANKQKVKSGIESCKLIEIEFNFIFKNFVDKELIFFDIETSNTINNQVYTKILF